MDMIPIGDYWCDLPENIQKESMRKSDYLGGGKTGMARRISEGRTVFNIDHLTSPKTNGKMLSRLYSSLSD